MALRKPEAGKSGPTRADTYDLSTEALREYWSKRQEAQNYSAHGPIFAEGENNRGTRLDHLKPDNIDKSSIRARVEWLIYDVG